MHRSPSGPPFVVVVVLGEIALSMDLFGDIDWFRLIVLRPVVTKEDTSESVTDGVGEGAEGMP